MSKYMFKRSHWPVTKKEANGLAVSCISEGFNHIVQVSNSIFCDIVGHYHGFSGPWWSWSGSCNRIKWMGQLLCGLIFCLENYIFNVNFKSFLDFVSSKLEPDWSLAHVISNAQPLLQHIKLSGIPKKMYLIFYADPLHNGLHVINLQSSKYTEVCDSALYLENTRGVFMWGSSDQKKWLGDILSTVMVIQE